MARISVTMKAAYITTAAVLLGAVITGIFTLISWEPTSKPSSNNISAKNNINVEASDSGTAFIQEGPGTITINRESAE